MTANISLAVRQSEPSVTSHYISQAHRTPRTKLLKKTTLKQSPHALLACTQAHRTPRTKPLKKARSPAQKAQEEPEHAPLLKGAKGAATKHDVEQP